MTGYYDLDTIHAPTTGAYVPAQWGDAVGALQDWLWQRRSCRVSVSGEVNLPDTDWTELPLGTDGALRRDRGGWLVDSGRVTAPVDGWMLATMNARIDTGASGASGRGTRLATYDGAGVTQRTVETTLHAAPGGTTEWPTRHLLWMAAGWTLAVELWQDHGADGDGSGELTVSWAHAGGGAAQPSYVDLDTIHTPSGGGVPPATWGQQVRENLEFLARPPLFSGLASFTHPGGGAGSWAYSTWDTASANAWGMWPGGGTPDLTLPVDGYYRVVGLVTAHDATVLSYIASRVLRNGSAVEQIFHSAGFRPSVSTPIDVGFAASATDTIRVEVDRPSSGDVDVDIALIWENS